MSKFYNYIYINYNNIYGDWAQFKYQLSKKLCVINHPKKIIFREHK